MRSFAPRAALLIESSNAYGRGLLAGVHDHESGNERWLTFLPDHGRGAPPLAALHAWRGDGIVARIESERIAGVVARLAATHLREIGLRNFASCGDRRFRWSDNRLRSFVAEMERHGHAVETFLLPAGGRRGGDEDGEKLGRWLSGLAKPVGVFACSDALGRRIIDACNTRSLAVPDDVAVLGVDDELLCRLATPPCRA